MSSHLEVFKPSGRELVPLTGQRVTLGKASTNGVALEHDDTVSRLHAVLENLGSPGRSGTWAAATARISTARRSLPNAFCAPETRCASASHGWSSGGAGRRRRRLDEETVAARAARAPAAADQARTRRARGVVPATGLRRPVSRAGVGPADGRRDVRHRGSRQTASAEFVRQVRHPRPRATAGSGWPTRRCGVAPSRSPSCATAGLSEVERLDGGDRTFVSGPVGAPDAVDGRADRRRPPGRAPEC